jgi:hypothetical protein
MSEYNYYFNAEHPLKPFTCGALANPGSFPPDNAVRTPPPARAEGFWPCLVDIVHGVGAWQLIEDHRGQKGYLDGQEAEIKEVGPYPDNWSFEPPAPTPEQVKAAEVSRIQGVLFELDLKSTRPIRSIMELQKELANTTIQTRIDQIKISIEKDEEKLAELESQAQIERDKLSALLE